MHKDILFLFEKDRELIRAANKYRLEYVGLSFVRSADNVRETVAVLNDMFEGVKEVIVI